MIVPQISRAAGSAHLPCLRVRPRSHTFLRDMIAFGLGALIMFWADRMRWPETTGAAVECSAAAGFRRLGDHAPAAD